MSMRPDLRCISSYFGAGIPHYRFGFVGRLLAGQPRHIIFLSRVLVTVILLAVIASIVPTGLYARDPSGNPVLSKEREERLAPIAEGSSKTLSSKILHVGIEQILFMLFGLALGCAVGWLRLLSRFYRFRGLGLVTSPWSWVFLAWVAVPSGISSGVAMEPVVSKMEPFMSSGLAGWVVIMGSSALGNASSILGRFLGKLHHVSATVAKIPDVKDAKSDNFFFQCLLESILDNMDEEVDRMARAYKWDVIKSSISKLIAGEITMGRLRPEEGKAAEQEVNNFQPSDDQLTDVDNKYKALHAALRVSSFRQLRSRLARATN